VRALIAEQGFHISMDAVAARAGCSKQTLYSHYGSKDELLRRAIIDRLKVTTAPLDTGEGDLRDLLLAFAMEHLEHLAHPDTVAARRLFMADAHRFAEEAAHLFRIAVEGLHERLALRLEAAIAQGQLGPADPAAAAELLLAMVAGADPDRRHFSTAHRQTPDARRAWAEFAVDAFLRAFAPPIPLPDPGASPCRPDSA
jgi:AcrR family transcriptional regulator